MEVKKLGLAAIGPDERDRQIMTERALRLAKRVEIAETQNVGESILVLLLGAERFAVPVKAVASILPLANLVAVPGAEPEMLGIMAVKGDVHCIFDLARLLALPEAGGATAEREGYVLILRLPGAHLGLLVDKIEAIDQRPVDPKAEPVTVGGPEREYPTPQNGAPLVLINDFSQLLEKFLNGETPL